MDKNKNKIKKIFSLNLICFLRCNGIKEKSVGFNYDTKKVYFVFEDNAELAELVDTYRDSHVMVKLHDFIAEFKQLKEEMFKHSKEFQKK